MGVSGAGSDVRRGVALALLMVGVGLVTACGGAPGRQRVIVLGLDGLDPEAVDLLIGEGRLPNLARLRAQGASGLLSSAEPRLSPVLWTTIATGKGPLEHGIAHSTAVNAAGDTFPVTSQMRKARALWNIASDAGRQVAVVGWWATWPAEQVNGAVVSDHTCYHFLFRQAETGGRTDTGLTHPPELAGEIAALVRRPDHVDHAEIRRFAEVGVEELERPYSAEDELSQLRWALASGDSHRRIGLHLWSTLEPDLLMVYIEGTDSVSHLFGHLFRANQLDGELARQQRALELEPDNQLYRSNLERLRCDGDRDPAPTRTLISAMGAGRLYDAKSNGCPGRGRCASRRWPWSRMTTGSSA